MREGYTEHLEERENAFSSFVCEERDKADLRSEDLSGRICDTVKALKGAANEWIKLWAEKVDHYNESVYEEELVRVQAWLDRNWDQDFSNMSLLEKASVSVVQGVDRFINVVPHDDATRWVWFPKLIIEDRGLWPREPDYSVTEGVYVYYTPGSGGRNPQYHTRQRLV